MPQIKVLIVDHTGGKVTPVEVPNDVVLRRLIPALVTRMQLPTIQGGTSIYYRLDHERTARRLGDDETLSSAGVQPDDRLRLLAEFTAGGVLPIRTFRDFLITDAILSKLASDSALGAILLYTDWDVSLAEFVRTSIDELDRLADRHCNLYLIEEPTERWTEKNRAVLKEQVGENFDFLWSRIGWSSSKPYDRAEAIEIARQFSVEPDELPCVILFNSGNSKNCLLISLNLVLPAFSDNIQEDYKRFFRTLFSLASRVSAYPSEVRLTVFEKSAKETWKSRQQGRISKALDSTTKQISLQISIVDVLKAIVAAFGLAAH